VATASDVEAQVEGQRPCEAEVISGNQGLNRNRTRGSRSGWPRRFPRSHSTGHSLVQPGENTDRFTLRLPVEVRNQLMNRKLNRSSSMVLTTLPREGSSRHGYRTGGVLRQGSSRRGRSLRWLTRSGRWGFNIPPIFSKTDSVKSPKAAVKDGESSSVRSNKKLNSFGESSRPPV
jgi:E3 ubiquitin-protein ligase ATL6/9/15/31/42/55